MPINRPEPASQNDLTNPILGSRTHAVLIICISLLLLGANEWLYSNAPEYFHSDARSVEYAAAAISFIVLLIAFLFRPFIEAIRKRRHSVIVVGSIESFRHGNPLNFVLASAVGVSIAVLTLSQANWVTKFLGLITICLIPGVVLQSRKISINLALAGSYESALQVQKWIRFLPDCGEILKGWILVEAGRYGEARKVLVNRAFDARQRPLPYSFYLVLYGYALGAEGLLDEALDVFESGYRAVHGFGNYGMELASCLLAKGIDAKRAKELIEEAMTTCAFERDADLAHALGLHAYALASNGLLDQAKVRLQEAFAASSLCKLRDQAFMWSIAGAAYRAAGELHSARKAFEEAIRIHPFGDVRLRAEKWLRLLDDERDSAI